MKIIAELLAGINPVESNLISRVLGEYVLLDESGSITDSGDDGPYVNNILEVSAGSLQDSAAGTISEFLEISAGLIQDK